ncbi:MAG: cytochrome c [Chloroflexi bacterium]|nr:cytochrome c [Chloroflexota bacterium]
MNHSHLKTKTSLIFLLVASMMVLGLLGTPVQPETVWAQSGPVGAAYRGQSVFNKQCTECHGGQGRGDGPLASQAPVPIADFTDPTFIDTRSPQYLFDLISNGKMDSLMPPWGQSLSQGEIWDTVAYVWSLHLADNEFTQAALVYQVACAQCHGDTGEGGSGDSAGPALNTSQLLSQDDETLRNAVLADSHPPVDNAALADLSQALVAVRSFSLGIGETSPAMTGDGVITVTVGNGTTNESMIDLPVRLVIFEGESFYDIQDAMSDENGVAVFANLPTDTTWAYIVEVIYNSVPYDSELQQFDATTSALEVPMFVYETGATLDDVRISRAHWVVSLENPNQVDIGELYAFTNTGDRVYVGEGGADVMPPKVLSFVFPEDAVNLSVEGGDTGKRFIIEGNQATDTMPLVPGTRQILFRYSLPVKDGSASLGHVIQYPVDFLNLLVPDVGIQVEAPDWTAGDLLKTQSGSYLNYVLTKQPAGLDPQTRLTNISAKAVQQTTTNTQQGQQVIDANATPGISGSPYLPWVLAIAAVLLLTAGTVLVVRHQRAVATTMPHTRRRQQEELIEQIADLDDAFETGELDRSDYDAQRQMLKTQLAALMRKEQA